MECPQLPSGRIQPLSPPRPPPISPRWHHGCVRMHQPCAAHPKPHRHPHPLPVLPSRLGTTATQILTHRSPQEGLGTGGQGGLCPRTSGDAGTGSGAEQMGAALLGAASAGQRGTAQALRGNQILKRGHLAPAQLGASRTPARARANQRHLREGVHVGAGGGSSLAVSPHHGRPPRKDARGERQVLRKRDPELGACARRPCVLGRWGYWIRQNPLPGRSRRSEGLAMSKGKGCRGKIPAERSWLRNGLLEAVGRWRQRWGPVQALMGFLAPHEPMGRRYAADAPQAALPLPGAASCPGHIRG